MTSLRLSSRFTMESKLPHNLEPGHYRVFHNGQHIGFIKVRGIWSDGCDLIDLFNGRDIRTGDSVEYKAVEL